MLARSRRAASASGSCGRTAKKSLIGSSNALGFFSEAKERKSNCDSYRYRSFSSLDLKEGGRPAWGFEPQILTAVTSSFAVISSWALILSRF